ncbi:hypothetical protein GCWU000324_01402 [Kingella oralis ATCC 51147]|uniref:Uncharacterized protein n=1 Tax=Kingella oralis ATCC 51147 TaxID=629741 RepID=C4GGY2_9NEIS|nr:hypothetical protein GCWU000324_01402 [Kingella oralis ATCC 51147]
MLVFFATFFGLGRGGFWGFENSGNHGWGRGVSLGDAKRIARRTAFQAA